MTPEHKAVFHQAVTDVLVAKGTPVTTGRTTYGWQADDLYVLREHMEGCEPDYESSAWNDSTWTEWMGTFDDNEFRQGIDLVLTCKCGAVRGRHWRYTDGYADLIRAVTGES